MKIITRATSASHNIILYSILTGQSDGSSLMKRHTEPEKIKFT